MILCDMGTWVSLFLILIILGLFCFWVFNIIKERTGRADVPEQIIQCPYCGNMIRDDRRGGVVICNLCQSYLESECEDGGSKK